MPEAESNALRHDYEISIRTTPEALWDAITSGEQTRRYFHGTRIESEWRVGAAVIYHSSRAGNMSPSMARCGTSSGRAGSPTRGTFATTPSAPGGALAGHLGDRTVGETCRLTLTHRSASRARPSERSPRVGTRSCPR